jgi:hypothetical protein
LPAAESSPVPRTVAGVSAAADFHSTPPPRSESPLVDPETPAAGSNMEDVTIPPSDNQETLAIRASQEVGPLQAGHLLGGVLSADLASLRGAVDQFFERLESLGDDWTQPSLFTRLIPWAVASAAVAVLLDVAYWQRRKADPIAALCSPDARDPRWASFLDLALSSSRSRHDG